MAGDELKRWLGERSWFLWFGFFWVECDPCNVSAAVPKLVQDHRRTQREAQAKARLPPSAAKKGGVGSVLSPEESGV
jgi:hypothetical protein